MIRLPRPLRLLPAVGVLVAAGCSGDLPPNVKIAREPAQGLSEAVMDAAWVQRLEQETLEAARARLDDTFSRNEVPERARTTRVRTRAQLLDWQGRPLGLVEIAYSDTPVRVTRVSGLQNGQLVTVACTAPRGEPLEPFAPDSECGAVVTRTFEP